MDHEFELGKRAFRGLYTRRASYRSLLDTAETIIDMEVRMEQVESKLSRVGQSCNSRGLERIATNADKMDTHTWSRGQSTLSHWVGIVG
jgi:division protein CdvB (Snf7/Vps24/ESCRT-III family)